MNNDLRQFVMPYLTIVLGTLMVVSFVAFLSIPYSLGSHQGDARVTQESVQVPISVMATDEQV